jgi:hypothetical protein
MYNIVYDIQRYYTFMWGRLNYAKENQAKRSRRDTQRVFAIAGMQAAKNEQKRRDLIDKLRHLPEAVLLAQSAAAATLVDLRANDVSNISGQLLRTPHPPTPCHSSWYIHPPGYSNELPILITRLPDATMPIKKRRIRRTQRRQRRT